MAAITRVYTIRYVANELGVSEEFIADITLTDMDPEHGHLWIYDLNDEHCEGFTPDGVEHLRELIADRAARQIQ